MNLFVLLKCFLFSTPNIFTESKIRPLFHLAALHREVSPYYSLEDEVICCKFLTHADEKEAVRMRGGADRGEGSAGSAGRAGLLHCYVFLVYLGPGGALKVIVM